jgi:hypothetical protein
VPGMMPLMTVSEMFFDLITCFYCEPELLNYLQ